MITTCPCCHAKFALEAALQGEEAGRFVLLLAKLPATTSSPLLSYLGLFRSKTRALAWARVLRMAKEVLALPAACGLSTGVLPAALQETVEALKRKRMDGEGGVLSNHNYLKKVMQSRPNTPGYEAAPSQEIAQAEAKPTSKTERGIKGLNDYARGKRTT